MRKTCLDMVYEMAKSDERIVFIGSDLGVGVLAAFKEEMPDRFFMEGVSEAHIVGMAAGLAMEGRIVYVNTIATFLSRRCFEQVVLDLGLHDLNVRLIANGGGFVYAPLGPTHLATDDIAIMRTIPNMTIVAPADADEMRRLMPQTDDHAGPMYIRLAKGYDPIVTNEEHGFEVGRAILDREGSDALLVTTGVCLGIAQEAASHLSHEGVEVSILHVPTIKPLDEKALVDAARDVPVILSIEEHTVLGGLGGSVAEVLFEADFDDVKRFRRIGIPDAWADQYGSQASLMARFDITAHRVCDELSKLTGSAVGAPLLGDADGG